ncbi:Uncharacterized protein TPAR_01930 [Tolypocladium paradoxum]|uniref:Uncharacterized protein n=1 Tax=Tolypocladium paradoxum TaxID=94208 RepID=A0A2S4L5Z7_9HYPO|nr:Uncharacterized protein TPAR_01930 [Tolypocladium paradoxum]
MPFVRDPRGIVITSKSANFGIAVAAILMLRHVGSKLPIELFLDSTNNPERRLCDRSLANLQLTCLNMDDFLRLPETSDWKTPKLEKHQFKPFSVLFSSFQEVLFLDADPWFGYLAGLLVPTISPLFYDIAEAQMPNIALKSRASVSGLMLHSKAKHVDSVYYNSYGPKYYYQLYS